MSEHNIQGCCQARDDLRRWEDCFLMQPETKALCHFLREHQGYLSNGSFIVLPGKAYAAHGYRKCSCPLWPLQVSQNSLFGGRFTLAGEPKHLCRTRHLQRLHGLGEHPLVEGEWFRMLWKGSFCRRLEFAPERMYVPPANHWASQQPTLRLLTSWAGGRLKSQTRPRWLAREHKLSAGKLWHQLHESTSQYITVH